MSRLKVVDYDPVDEYERQKKELDFWFTVATNVAMYGHGDNNEVVNMQLNDRANNTHQFRIFELTQELEKVKKALDKASIFQLPLLKRKAQMIKDEIESLKKQDSLVDSVQAMRR